ncbi:MAG: Mur ligase family protein [Pseudomonadota bacterium]
MLRSELDGQSLGLLGFGREGQATRTWLRKAFPDLPLTLYSESPLPATVVDALGQHDRLVVAPLDGAALRSHDVLVRSPGISPYRKELREAGEAGVRFTSGTNLWMTEHSDVRTLCVTGTKGKSTTTALLTHLLSAAGARVRMAGNIGIPLVACDPTDADWWVVELSSYQLCDLEAPPWLALLLNLSDEHLDWHGSAERYHRDKLRLAELAPSGRLLANGQCPLFRSALAHRTDTAWYNMPETIHVQNGVLWRGAERLPDLPGAPGPHNLENLAGALSVLDHIGLWPEPLAPALASFKGLPHRQYTLGWRGGLRFVDDSLSTTPVATLAALEALRVTPGGDDAQVIDGQPSAHMAEAQSATPAVTVLVGGLDRGIDWSVHIDLLRRAAPHTLIGLPDSGSRLIRVLEAAGLRPPGGMHVARDMREAVDLALCKTPRGGTVLLSPGAPSFPVYRDYRERAQAFAQAAGLSAA